MNIPIDADHDPDDRDIDQLFQLQSNAIPAALDSVILTAAKDAVKTSTEINSSRFSPKSRPISGQWFALAAMLVLSIGIVPLLLKMPGSDQDEPGHSSDYVSASRSAQPLSTQAADIVAEPMAQSPTSPVAAPESATVVQSQATQILTDSQSSKRIRISGSTDITAAESSRSMTASADTANSIQMRTEASASDATAGKLSEFIAPPDTRYRNAPDTWLNRIKMLSFDGDRRSAEDEYDLFREKHPEYEKDYRPQVRVVPPEQDQPLSPVRPED